MAYFGGLCGDLCVLYCWIDRLQERIQVLLYGLSFSLSLSLSFFLSVLDEDPFHHDCLAVHIACQVELQDVNGPHEEK